MQTWLDKYEYNPLDSLGGSVYRGRNKATGQALAIKLQSVHLQWERGMFAQRIERLPELRHPHLLAYSDAETWMEEGDVRTLALAMPIVEAGSLDAKNPMEWTFQQKSDLAEGVLKALAFLHGKDLVCQTLCASHLLLLSVNDVLIPQLINYINPIKIPLAFFKSYEYLAPEQLNEAEPISAQTDIWAFGVLLHWIWTGNLPFGKLSATLPNAKIKDRILQRPVPDTIAGLPDWIQTIIRGCLHKNPAERWAGADELYVFYLQEKEQWLEREEAAAEQAAQEEEIDEPSASERRKPLWQRRFKRKPSRPLQWWHVVVGLTVAGLLGWLLNKWM